MLNISSSAMAASANVRYGQKAVRQSMASTSLSVARDSFLPSLSQLSAPQGIQSLSALRFGAFTYPASENMLNQLRTRALKSPGGTALQIAESFADPNQTLKLTNRRLYENVARMTRVLKEKYNIQPGDRIAAVESNTPEFVTLFYATLAAGASLAAVNVAAMADQPESLLHMLKVSNAKMLFIGNDKAYAKVQKLKDLEPLLNPTTRQRLETIPGWLISWIPGVTEGIRKFKASFEAGQKALANPDVVKAIQALPPNLKIVLPGSGVFEGLDKVKPLPDFAMEFEPNPEQDALVLFTSGTESLPKAVPISHKALIHNTVYLRKLAQSALDKNASLMMALPLFHIFGMAVFHVGMTSDVPVVLVPSLKEAFGNIPKLLDAVDKEKPTVLPLIPGIVKKMVSVPGALKKMQSLQVVITGGDKLQRELYDTLKEGIPGVKVWEGYGMTEIGILTLNTEGEYGTVGKPISEHIKVEFRRSLEDGLPPDVEQQQVPPHSDGEIWVHTPSRGKTYQGAPQEKIDELFKPGGWAKTGDIGHADQGGYLHLTGRSKDTYKRNGEYTPMSRVNGYVSLLSGVKNVFSFPYTVAGDPEEKIMTLVTLKSGTSATAESLRQGLQKLVDEKKMAPRFLSHYTMILPGEEFPASFMGTDGKMKTKNARALLDRLQRENAIVYDKAKGVATLSRPEALPAS